MKRLFVLAVLALALPAAANEFHGRVVSVLDGDTVIVLTGGREEQRVRLFAIDAPEKSQDFGQRSKQHLAECAFGKNVTVEWHERDRYNRVVGKVIANGTDCNLSQVESGFAWHYTQYERKQSPEDRAAYAKAEREARAAKRGLWQDANPTPPWEYRHGEAPTPPKGGAVTPTQDQRLLWGTAVALLLVAGVIAKRTWRR